MPFENPSENTAETKEKLKNLFINGSLREGVTEEQALEAQRDWEEKGRQWEERHKIYWEAFSKRPAKYGEKNEFEEIEVEAKKIADDYYKAEYVPAYHRYTDLWTFPGRTEKTDAPKENTRDADALRKELDRFKN